MVLVSVPRFTQQSGKWVPAFAGVTALLRRSRYVKRRVTVPLASAILAVNTGAASAQAVVADSQAIAAAIIRSILPDLRTKNEYRGPVVIQTGPIIGSAARPGSDITAPWLRSLQTQMRAQAPRLLSDSASTYLMNVKVSAVEILATSALVRGAYSRCNRGSSSMNGWVRILVHSGHPF